MELLKETVPGLTDAAMLINPADISRKPTQLRSKPYKYKHLKNLRKRLLLLLAIVQGPA